MDALGQAVWNMELAAIGYIYFFDGVGRVCASSDHPRWGKKAMGERSNKYGEMSVADAGQWRGHQYIQNNPYMDLYSSAVGVNELGLDKGDTIYDTFEPGEPAGRIRRPVKLYFPLASCKLHASSFPCPAQTKRVLEMDYGKGWQQGLPGSNEVLCAALRLLCLLWQY